MQSANTAADRSSPLAAASANAQVAPAASSPEFLERFLDACAHTRVADCASTPVAAKACALVAATETQSAHGNAPNELRFDHFMRLALYDAAVGYYAQPNRPRVGRRPGTDFYTATNVGQNPHNADAAPATSLFGELVVQSCLALMGEAFCARATFIEIGSEPESGILRNLVPPFAAARTISLGQPIEVLGAVDAPLIVFSNELFDAQPCRRFVWRESREGRNAQNTSESGWYEVYVRAENGTLSEIEHPLGRVPKFLPKTAPDGYRIDAPLNAKTLLDQIASQPWHGLFLAFDYGKSWAELVEATPQGTARAYTQHRQTNDLLTQPGQQDLTCHVCWDWLQASLAENDFGDSALDTQEAFFVKHAGGFIAEQIAADAQKLSARKQALLQLLHPAHLGQKFQVLSAKRVTE